MTTDPRDAEIARLKAAFELVSNHRDKYAKEIDRLTAERDAALALEAKALGDGHDGSEMAEAILDLTPADALDRMQKLLNAAIAGAYEAAAQAMGTYHWNRYAKPEEGGTLRSPAVFTSHTHQHVEEICRALTPADALAALSRRDAQMRTEGMRRALDVVSENADWPEDEHGRTEHPALFARISHAILAAAEKEASNG